MKLFPSARWSLSVLAIGCWLHGYRVYIYIYTFETTTLMGSCTGNDIWNDDFLWWHFQPKLRMRWHTASPRRLRLMDAVFLGLAFRARLHIYDMYICINIYVYTHTFIATHKKIQKLREYEVSIVGTILQTRFLFVCAGLLQIVRFVTTSTRWLSAPHIFHLQPFAKIVPNILAKIELSRL